MIRTKDITRTAALTAAAVLLGYVESLFPPIAAGVKLGLANTVVLFSLYTQSVGKAWVIAILKVLLCMMLFGNGAALLYSLSGAVMSVLVMSIAKKTGQFSLMGVSALGGISHNMAQLLCAYFIIGKGVLFYMPVLLVSGVVCGILTGIATHIIVKRRDLFGKE